MLKNYMMSFFSNTRNKTLRKCLLTAGFAVACSQGVSGQVSEYTFSQSNGTFNSIKTTGTLVTGSEATTSATNDTSGWSVTIPFNFNFNGVNYTEVYVNSNGAASFGATTSTLSSIISGTGTYAGAAAVMNRDLWGVFITSGVTTTGSNVITNVASFKGIEIGKTLNNVSGIPASTTITAYDEVAGTITMSNNATSSSSAAVVRYGTGKVLTAVEGTAPNRVFVIEWFGYNDYSTAVTGSNFMSFQLRLAETTNVVSFVYGDYYNVNTTSRTNQIGLRGASNADFNNRTGATATPWSSTTAGTSNSMTVSRDNTNFPASGLTFSWTPATCLRPTGINATSITQTSAIINWTAPSTTVGNGYDVYISNVNTAPISTTAPTFPNVTGLSTPSGILQPSTKYYVWLRSNCSTTDVSEWSVFPYSFFTLCQDIPLLSTNGATVCPGATAVLTATAAAGGIVKWFDSQTGGNALGTGNAFTTPALNATTTYYAGTIVDNFTQGSVGFANAVSTSGYTLDAGLIFDALTSFNLDGVYVYPMGTGAGTATIALVDGNVSPATVLQQVTVNLTGSAVPYVKTFVPLNFTITPGNNYKLMMLSRAGGVSGLVRESGTSWGSYPLTLANVVSITAGNLSGNSPTTSYYYFYDWQVTVGCQGPRTAVVATVDAAGCLATSEVNMKESFKVYPNPFTDVVNISNADKVKSATVMDVSGRLVKTIEKVSEKINLSDLKTGVYLLNLELKDGSKVSHKIMKK